MAWLPFAQYVGNLETALLRFIIAKVQCSSEPAVGVIRFGANRFRGVTMPTQPPLNGGCFEKTQEPSSGAELSVRIWGLAANGRAFAQTASLKNLAPSSALIGALLQEIAMNEVIGLQFKDVKTRVQIVWVDNRDAKNRTAEIRVAQNQACPWQNELLQADQSQSHLNRREFDRHAMSFPVEIKRNGSHAPMRLSAHDVSGSGCYLQTMSPSPAGSQLELTFWIDSEAVNCAGQVRTCDSGFGMGIEFVGLAAPIKQRLQSWLDANRRTHAGSRK
jgi:hypothetical protein